MVSRQQKINVGGNYYVVEFPNVGKIIDMESMKQALTNGKYGEMAKSGISSMYYALDLVDAIAFFQVCAPEIARRLNIKSYTELSAEEANEILRPYQEQVRPWYTSVLADMQSIQPVTSDGEGKSSEV